MPALGIARVGTFISVLDFLHLGVLMPLHSFVCPDPLTPTLKAVHPESPMLLQSLSYLGFLVLMSGTVWSGFLCSLFVVGIATLELPLFLRSTAKLGASMPAPRFAHVGLVMPSRRFA